MKNLKEMHVKYVVKYTVYLTNFSNLFALTSISISCSEFLKILFCDLMLLLIPVLPALPQIHHHTGTF